MMLEKLYEAIEKAVINNKPVKFPEEDIEKLQLKMLPGERILITNLEWVDNGKVYNPILGAEFRPEYYTAKLYVVGNISNSWSSDRTWMFVSENRYGAKKDSQFKQDEKLEEYKYNPADYPYPLNEDIEKVYSAYREKSIGKLEAAVQNLYFTLKQARRDNIISDVKVNEMQQYFLALRNF